eukprot:1323695-Rhodomonas_salina.1
MAISTDSPRLVSQACAGAPAPPTRHLLDPTGPPFAPRPDHDTTRSILSGPRQVLFEHVGQDVVHRLSTNPLLAPLVQHAC